MDSFASYKYRLYPNKTQQTLLDKTMGCARFYWNYLVEVFLSYDKETNPNPRFKTVKELRQEFEWMQEVSHNAVQQKGRDFREFKKQLFSKNRKKKIGYPKFKKKSNKQSFRLPNIGFKVIGNKIQLAKIGKVKIVVDRELPEGKLKSVAVSKNPSGQYFASILVETKIEPKPKTNKDVGIDLGIKTFATQSNGEEVANPRYLSESQAKVRRLQRHLSRKHKGSVRWNKTRLKIAKTHQKITNQRDNFLHNYTTHLVNNYDRIFIEDLDTEGMMKNHNLAGAIGDASWAKFADMLNYKADWYGKDVVKIDRFYPSSKTCECGYINHDLKLSDREWICPSCGRKNQRDLLASQNILREGRRSLGDKTDAEAEVAKPVKRLELK